jgi:cyclophilin family peptidyl-prolyl cis-trans isomerase
LAATQNFLALCACGAYDGTKFHRFVRLQHASSQEDASD